MLPNLLKKNSPVIGLEVSLIRDIPARVAESCSFSVLSFICVAISQSIFLRQHSKNQM